MNERDLPLPTPYDIDTIFLACWGHVDIIDEVAGKTLITLRPVIVEWRIGGNLTIIPFSVKYGLIILSTTTLRWPPSASPMSITCNLNTASLFDFDSDTKNDLMLSGSLFYSIRFTLSNCLGRSRLSAPARPAVEF